MKPLDIEKIKTDWAKDRDARRQWHMMMNYHYLMYKGISLLNHRYSKETLDSIGLQINVPRTFMTIESIRPDLNKPIDILLKWRNPKERAQAEAGQKMLKGEWMRSKADNAKADAEFDALVYGSGVLQSLFEKDEETMPVYDGVDKDGKVKYTEKTYTHYEGMKLRWVDPYNSFPDRKAKTYEPRTSRSRRYHWVYSVWDFDKWVEHCKDRGYKTDKMEKGGDLQDFGKVRRIIDALYTTSMRHSNRDPSTNQLVTGLPWEQTEQDWENSIMVLERWEDNRYTIFSGANWTVNFDDYNPNPKKEIPIYIIKDYDVPGELEGIGECEVLRWQQYEENKIHNLSYLQVLLNTVKRYGIIEELLVDPTEVRMGNPLKTIRLKMVPGQNTKVNDAVQVLNQASSNDYPQNYLAEVKGIGQSATGQTDYNIGASKSQADTLGEANKMEAAGNKRIRQKIQNMEERGLVPILEQWLSSIPQLYSEEMEYVLNDELQTAVKFIPYDRQMNDNAALVAMYSGREGVRQPDVNTIEGIFKAKGFQEVVFVSDLIGGYDVNIKTSLAYLDKIEMSRGFQEVIADARQDNMDNVAMGKPPVWDTSKLTEERLRQFPDIIDDVEQYKLPQQPIQQPIQQPAQLPAQPQLAPLPTEQPVEQPATPSMAPIQP